MHTSLPHVLLFLLAAALLFASDTKTEKDLKVKIVTQTSSPDGIFLADSPGLPWPIMTIYVHENLQRVEFPDAVDSAGPRKLVLHRMAAITHCDTGVVDQLDLDAHTYVEFKLDRSPEREQFAKQIAQAEKDDRKHSQFESRETGETRDYAGHVAKHVITMVKGKDKEVGYEETIDGWYLDIPEPGCAPEYMRQRHASMQWYRPLVSIPHNPYALPSVVRSGTVQWKLELDWYLPEGMALEQTTMQRQHVRVDGSLRDHQSKRVQKVVEFSSEPLNPALFEVPEGFRKVKEL